MTLGRKEKGQMFKVRNTKTGETKNAKTYAEALTLATIEHNKAKARTGEGVRFAIVKD